MSLMSNDSMVAYNLEGEKNMKSPLYINQYDMRIFFLLIYFYFILVSLRVYNLNLNRY